MQPIFITYDVINNKVYFSNSFELKKTEDQPVIKE